MILAAFEIRRRALRVAPVSPLDLAPPRSSDATRRPGVVWEESREAERPAESLGFGHVAGVVDEAGELCVRHRIGVDPEGRETDLAHRTLAVVRVRKAVLAP